MEDSIVELSMSVLSAESWHDAAEIVRLSGWRPGYLAEALTQFAGAMESERPALAALATLAADNTRILESPATWTPQDHLSPNVNDALLRASQASGWPAALSI